MSGQRCEVAVVGAGLVGLSLADELACLGASVTVIDAGHPGRATDAGAGILSPVTAMEAEGTLWPFLRQAGAHYPALLQRMVSDGVVVAGTGYGRCGILSIGLREHEDAWFAPFAKTVLRRSPGEVAEITPDEAGSFFPPLGAAHRALHAPGTRTRSKWRDIRTSRVGSRRRRRRLADRAAAAHPLSRALTRGAGGLRRDVRGRGRVLRQRDGGGPP